MDGLNNSMENLFKINFECPVIFLREKGQNYSKCLVGNLWKVCGLSVFVILSSVVGGIYDSLCEAVGYLLIQKI